MAADVQTPFSLAATLVTLGSMGLRRIDTMEQFSIFDFFGGAKDTPEQAALKATRAAQLKAGRPPKLAAMAAAGRCLRLLAPFADPATRSGGGLKLLDIASGPRAVTKAFRSKGSMLWWAASVETETEGGRMYEGIVAAMVTDPRTTPAAAGAVTWRWAMSAFRLLLQILLVPRPDGWRDSYIVAHDPAWWKKALEGGEAAYLALDDEGQYHVRTYRVVKAMLAMLSPKQGVLRRNGGEFDDSPRPSSATRPSFRPPSLPQPTRRTWEMTTRSSCVHASHEQHTRTRWL